MKRILINLFNKLQNLISKFIRFVEDFPFEDIFRKLKDVILKIRHYCLNCYLYKTIERLSNFLMRQDNKSLSVFFFWAVIIHIVFLGGFLFKKLKIAKENKEQVIISQITDKQKKTSFKDTEYRKLKVLKDEPVKPSEPVDIITKKKDLVSPLSGKVKDLTREKKDWDIKGNEKFKVRTFEGQRKVVVPFLKPEKIANPKYLSYNHRIREQIKQRAYNYIGSSNFENGQVYLSFIIDAYGQLQQLQIVEDKTDANEYLRKAGMRSVREAAPFPPFPNDLRYPELTFNIVISFEVK